MADPNAQLVNTTTEEKEDVLEDGTKVIHTITIETYTDGSQCKRTVTRRIGSKTTKEEDLGRPTVSLSFRNFRMCCCFIPLGKRDKDKEDEEGKDEGGDGEQKEAEESKQQEEKQEER